MRKKISLTYKKIFIKLGMQKIGKKYRKLIRNKIERKKINNKEFTILSNTCIGGVIYNDLGQRFLSPTINLYITPKDFVEFLENLDDYLSSEIEPVKSPLNYPIGKIRTRGGNITLYFKHYKTIEEAIQKWNERKTRINKDNLFIMMTDRWCLPYQYLKRFDNLKYKNKVCFTHKKYDEFKSCRVVKKWSDPHCVGTITDVANIFGKRLYQYAKNFNYIKWLNGESE